MLSVPQGFAERQPCGFLGSLESLTDDHYDRFVEEVSGLQKAVGREWQKPRRFGGERAVGTPEVSAKGGRTHGRERMLSIGMLRLGSPAVPLCSFYNSRKSVKKIPLFMGCWATW